MSCLSQAASYNKSSSFKTFYEMREREEQKNGTLTNSKVTLRADTAKLRRNAQKKQMWKKVIQSVMKRRTKAGDAAVHVCKSVSNTSVMALRLSFSEW